MYIDGIVNEFFYNKCPLKILWILKEVNHDGDLDEWNMCEILQDIKTNYGIEKGFARTFAPIVHLSYGLINRKKWTEVPYHYDDPNIIDILKNIAYINVKKTSGGSRIHNSSLQNAYNENQEKLYKQINSISPDIIIYGGTFHLFEKDNNKYLKNKNVKHISAYHPAQSTITQEEYFNRIYNQIYS